jgi:hypothetical protein
VTCFDLNGGGLLSGVTGHRQIVQSGNATIEATPVLNSNGKQITGFTLTGKSVGFTAVGYAKIRETGCPEGSVLFANTGTPTQPNTVSITSGLQVNGIDLPNTPVLPAV